MKRKLQIQKFIDWLIRDDITVKQKLLNVAIASVILVMIPCVLFGLFIYSNIFSVVLPLSGVAVAALGLWCVNNKKHYNLWAVSLTSIICFVILPICFFWDGGKDSSDDIWFMAGLIMLFLLLEGKIMWIMAMLDALVITLCFLGEYFHPEWVHHLGTPEDRIVEIFLSLLIIGTCLGATFSFQSRMYEKQAKELLDKERVLKEAMDALEKANNAKSDFLANMSHEIRTPINAVLGMNEMILREAKDERILEYSSNVDNAGRTLLSLVNDILDFSKIDSGKMDIVSLDYELFSLVKDCHTMVYRKAKEKKLEFTILNNPSLPVGLRGDEIRVRQILINLLTNAVKYTPAGSVTMKVDYRMTGEESLDLIVSVTDTGIGIKDEDKDSLFEKFERNEVEKNRNIEGTGLGLAITKNLIDMMHGSITVDSKYGLGTTFTVIIPQEISNPTFVGNLSDRFSVRANKEKYYELFKAPEAKILAVDDVKINNDVLCSLLKQTEVKIDCAYSGRECINVLRNKKYDLVLMDHMMPEMDGIETLKRVRALENSPNADTPVIIITANAVIGAREEYLKLGFDDYLSKPVESKELERVISKHLPVQLIESIEKKNDDSLAEKLYFLDVKSGINACAESEEIYLQALDNFHGRENKLDAVEAAFLQMSWGDYELLVHSLKNLCKLIGANDLSEEAKSLELAIKDGRIDTVLLNHELFMAHYASLLKKIDAYFEG